MHWEFTEAPFQWQVILREDSQFGADASDDALGSGGSNELNIESFAYDTGQLVVAGVRPFDGVPLGDFVWSPPVALIGG